MEQLVLTAVAELEQRNYASIHAMRTDPLLVRAKAQNLRELGNLVVSMLGELTNG